MTVQPHGMSHTQTPDQILELACRLMRDVNKLDLDMIDGEFYWRCCRPDFSAAVDQARSQFPPKPLRRNDIFKAIASVKSMVRGLHARFNIPQSIILKHVAYDAPISMRGHTITSSPSLDSDKGEPRLDLIIKVSSPNTKGEDIERALQSWYRPSTQGLDNNLTIYVDTLVEMREYRLNRGKRSEYSIHVSFDLIQQLASRRRSARISYFAPTNQYFADLSDVRPPFVQIIVSAPLPPPGILADLYDAIVRRQYQWHRELVGTVTRQNTKVAIRTWTVGLLMSRNAINPMVWQRAMSAYEIATGHRRVIQPKFNRDRRDLIARVPEAEEHVLARGRRSAHP